MYTAQIAGHLNKSQLFTEETPCARHYNTVYNVILLYLYKQPYERYYYHPQFTDEKTEA